MSFIGPKQLRQKELPLQLMISNKKDISDVIEKIKKEGISIKSIRIKDLETTQLVQLAITVHYQRKTVDVYTVVSAIEGITSVEIGHV